jgi:hypothetical protein
MIDHDVHDHGVSGLSVDYAGRQVVLHTVCPREGPEQFIDAVFDGVVAYRLEHETFGGEWHNCLFAIEEVDLRLPRCRRDITELWKKGEGYNWPLPDCANEEELLQRLLGMGCRFYEVTSACGLNGFVLAVSHTLRVRPSRHEGGGLSRGFLRGVSAGPGCHTTAQADLHWVAPDGQAAVDAGARRRAGQQKAVALADVLRLADPPPGRA